jgi:ABC-type Fe3+-hydroxamate transport system substrate-binding protein
MTMKTRFFLTCSLLAVLTSACASNATTTQPVVEPSAIVLGGALSPVDLTATQVFTESLLSATPPVDAQPVATSRGPELHATDPTTVSLASGQIQFVEFFRFT